MLPFDISDILEIDRKEFINELRSDNEISRSFKKGYLKTEYNIKKNTSMKFEEETEMFLGTNDVEESEFLLKNMQIFKSKLTIQLYA